MTTFFLCKAQHVEYPVSSMATKQTQQDELAVFTEGLKREIRAWLASTHTRQSELADRMGMTPSAISANLRFNHSMTENFVRSLSRAVPEFSEAIVRYFEIKNGVSFSPELGNAIRDKKAQAERIKALRHAEKEVIEAIRALSDIAVKIIEDQ